MKPSAFADDRKLTYLNDAARGCALINPVTDDTIERARRYRLQRLRDQLASSDAAALLLYDPVNIRYAFDCSNMQVWTLHNPMRYALIFAEGPAMMFEFAGCLHLSQGLPGIDDLRVAKTCMFMASGDKLDAATDQWADEIADLVRTHGGARQQIACDRLDVGAVQALANRGVSCCDGTRITEIARSIKSADELDLMRWTIRVCEAGLARIYAHSQPGVSERELWGHLHFENARSGGDWLETKLLTCGPRTNPWYQECSARPCQLGEMIALDTDMIGPYGYCADLSRSWTCGYTTMNATQKRLYSIALDQILHNLELIRPGVSFADFNARSWRIPEPHIPYRYSLAVHGVGMADEWPVIPLHVDWGPGAMSGHFEAGMVVCVESLIAERGSESVKLETQILITETGIERLDTFPFEST